MYLLKVRSLLTSLHLKIRPSCCPRSPVVKKKSRTSSFADCPSRIFSNTLSDRLDGLVAVGIRGRGKETATLTLGPVVTESEVDSKASFAVRLLRTYDLNDPNEKPSDLFIFIIDPVAKRTLVAPKPSHQQTHLYRRTPAKYARQRVPLQPFRTPRPSSPETRTKNASWR
jgi:hypothetical protein